jgi:hypothetical protein
MIGELYNPHVPFGVDAGDVEIALVEFAAKGAVKAIVAEELLPDFLFSVGPVRMGIR